MKIAIITLGCSKNIVDSEKLAGILKNKGIEISFENVERCDAAIINTCGFILDSQEESIDTILECVRMKADGRRKLKKVFVFGCLVARNRMELKQSIPEVDGWYGINDMEAVANDMLNDCGIREKSKGNATMNDACNAVRGSLKPVPTISREISTPKHYAYLKISEGCNKFCSFCAIPLIRGKHISLPKEEIIREAEFLHSQGVKEVILIAQDLTFYGSDNYHSLELCDLVRKISAIGFDWIRLHYAHPNEINDDVLNLYNELPNLCKYLDIPLQHISTPILKSMKRNIDREGTIALIKHIRKVVPDIAIRTAFIVGYPGETEEQYQELVDFVKDMKFERLGVFTFSPEEDTVANELEDDVPEDVKQRRREDLLAIQQDISLKNNEKFVNRTIRVLIDYKEDDYFIGRSEYDSPEVDNEVVINSDKPLKTGEFYNVEITSAECFDLNGKF